MVKVVGTHSLDGKGYIDRETAEKIRIGTIWQKEDSLKFKNTELDDGASCEIEVKWFRLSAEAELGTQ